MNRKLRTRLLEKLAQTTAPGNLPTTQTTSVSGSPPTFVATDYYPIVLAFGAKNVPIINNLTNAINQALYYTSSGKIHLQWMKLANFNSDTSNTNSLELKNLMNFAKQIYNQIYTNNGKLDNKQLSPQEISARIAPLKTSMFLSNLSSTNPIGQLASKIGGNIKTLVNNYLLQIK